VNQPDRLPPTKRSDPAPLTEANALRASEVDSSLEEADTDRPPPPDPIHSLTDGQVLSELAELIATPEAVVERRILLYLVRRYFGLGLRCYGPVRLHDGRRNRTEAMAELADLLFYLGKQAIEEGA